MSNDAGAEINTISKYKNALGRGAVKEIVYILLPLR